MAASTTLRAAIYCRVSTDGQEENASLPTQEAACRAYAAERGYSVAEVYTDVHSGFELWERPRLTILREAIRQGGLDAIICHALDRLSRRQVHTAILIDECERAGVALLFVTEEFERSAVGEFIRSAKSFAAELEREKIKERTMRGLENKVRSGRPIGSTMYYGYRWRDDAKSGYAIDETTGPIVRRIFALALAGQSLRSIGHTLSTEGIPTATGNARWAHSSVVQILENRVYLGEATAWRYRTEHAQGRRTTRRRPESEHIPLPAGTIPPLVDDATFEAVQARLARNKAEAVRNNRHHEAFLLRSGYAICGYCGMHLTTKFAPARWQGTGPRPQYYLNRAKCNHHACGHSVAITATTLDGAVWDRVEALLTRPEIVAAELSRLRTEDPVGDDLAAVERMLADVGRKQANLTRAIAVVDDPDAAAPLVGEVAALGKRRRALEEERDGLRARRGAWQSSQEQLDGLAEWCRTVGRNLRDLTYSQKRQVLAALDVKAKLYQADHTPRYEIVASIPLGAAPGACIVDSAPRRAGCRGRAPTRPSAGSR